MSKTVVILVTAVNEYRVAVVDNADELYIGINVNTSKWIPNVSFIRKHFDMAIVWHFENNAIDFAKTLAESQKNADLEGGIRIIDIWSDTEYNSL